MTTDFVEEKVSLDATDAPPTRWQAQPLQRIDDANEPERGGLVLAALIALLLPLIIAAVVLLPSSKQADSVSTDDGGGDTGLDAIAVDPAPGRDEELQPAPAETEVLGTTETTAASGDSTPTTVASDDADPEAEPSTPATDTSSDSAAVAPLPVGPSPTTPEVSPPASVSTTVTASTTAFPTTTVTATTGAPTTVTPTTSSPPPTTTAAPTTSVPVTTTPTDGEPDPSAFAERVEIGQIGETFVRYRFTAEDTTSYAAVVRNEDGIVATTTGTAVGGEEVAKSANGLTPGTDYTVRVRLLGPPEVASVPVPFRTSGGAPDPTDVPVEILDVDVVEVAETKFVVNYRTNICANGSFVVRRLGGEVVGRNGGQADGCTTRHLAIPGFWTPALEPDSVYVLTIAVEADGQGRGNGNTASTSIVVTTSD